MSTLRYKRGSLGTRWIFPHIKTCVNEVRMSSMESAEFEMAAEAEKVCKLEK